MVIKQNVEWREIFHAGRALPLVLPYRGTLMTLECLRYHARAEARPRRSRHKRSVLLKR